MRCVPFLSTLCLALCLTSVDLAAQSSAFALVAVRDPFAPSGRASRVLRVDLQLGTSLDLGRFTSDGLPVEAIAWDPVARAIVLALREPTSTRLVRLEWNGSAITGERAISRLLDPVTSLSVAWRGDLYLTTARGIYRTPRNGGSVFPVLAQRAASALVAEFGASYALLANGREIASGTEPGFCWVDLQNGTITSGPFSFPGFAGNTITGIADLPTGAPREVLSDELGNALLSTGFQDPTPIPGVPSRGPGSSVALRAENAFEMLVLGGSARPYLDSFVAFGQPAPSWTQRAGPFLGDPIDFCLVPAAQAEALAFGESCGPGFASLDAPLAPLLGTPNFELRASGFAAQIPLIFALGLSEQSFAGLALPVEIFPGCFLAASGEVLLLTSTDVRGDASLFFALPSAPWLAGRSAYAQTLQLVPPERFSNALALHLR
ncbi:MAG: hypothetical protein JNM84_19380 [Planctomycetes bacterium]|nr:hypothetical protein [Planctomycetota bacterium]